MDVRAAVALTRFGLGRRGEAAPPDDPAAWLAYQLDGPDPALAAPCHASADGVRLIQEFRRAKPGENDGAALRAMFRADTAVTMNTLVTTDTPFRERLVWFWANHFTVSLRRVFIGPLVNAYLREAIRPHVTGRFEDMLLAVMRHPAMLLYLDNAGSVGPQSKVGEQRKIGLNENLARECMELHTVTPAAGYSQADVTAFAAVLTGWSIGFERPEAGFFFRPRAHEPGTQMVMGQRFPAGEAGGVAALKFLAAHPATARNLATKLVRHFVADAPAPDDVARIAGVLQRSGGDLRLAALEVTRIPAAWQPLSKLRSPFDYVVAAQRAVDLGEERRGPIFAMMAGLGQSPFSAPLPNGWPDTTADWAGPEAMMRRLDWAFAFAARASGLDPVEVADASLGPLLPASTREMIGRAGSQREAMTLLLAAPEFQRR